MNSEPSARNAGNPPDFFITGGTLRPDAPCYVERAADKEIYARLRNGDFCYVLTSRQMGKSSLMVRAVRRLRQEKQHVAVLDLTAIGQNLTIEQWYDGLMARLGQQLDLEDELLDFWRAHAEWGPLQRWATALEKIVLPNRQGQVIVFVDEIDIVRSLPFSTDEFFAAIRECHNRRSHNPEYRRLSFCLLGVAAPTDLIRDTRLTPFNVGHRIELNDFSPEEARPLAEGFAAKAGGPAAAEALLLRVLYWTHGHPYLTQRLCQAVSREAAAATPAEVDRRCAELFLSPRALERDDNLLFVRDRLLRGESDLSALLAMYTRVLRGQPVPDDESNPLVSLLLLSGVARVVAGRLESRNRIYATVFDKDWARVNLPGADVRRQKGAFRKGLWRGVVIAFVLFLIRGQYMSCRHAPPEGGNPAELFRAVQRTWRAAATYQDRYESVISVKYNNQEITASASGYLQYARPRQWKQTFNSAGAAGRINLDCGSDGGIFWIYDAVAGGYATNAAPTAWERAVFAPSLSSACGPLGVAPLFRLWFLRQLTNSQPVNLTESHQMLGDSSAKEPVIVLRGEYDLSDFLSGLGWISGEGKSPERVPVSLWIYPESSSIARLELNLTRFATNLVTLPAPAQPQSVRLILKLSGLRWNQSIPDNVFHFTPPPEAKWVAGLGLTEKALDLDNLYRSQVLRQIPARFPEAPPQLVDLSQHYNASLRESWTAGASGNDLSPLPPGLLYFAGVLFDVRGLIQLDGELLRQSGGRYPAKLSGLVVEQKGRRLHFLHGCCWTAEPGTKIGGYEVRYASGESRLIPIKYGEDVLDWHVTSRGPGPFRLNARSSVNQVWSGRNRSNADIALFETAWDNPLPDVRIETIDFISEGGSAAPFLLSITVEP